MSILRSKHSGWTHEGRRTPHFGGGGGGSAPSTSTAYNTNIPEYAKPYVTTMLGATQRQLFEGTPTEGGGFDITGFKPYRPYSTDVNQYFAGFSPLQQQAQQATAGLTVPGQYQQATGLTGLGALGAMGLAGRAAGAGGQYAQMATSPEAQQAYMSPYMQNVVDYQKMQALRDYQIGEPLRARQAIGAGAFGGSRQAIERAEAQRNLMSQLQGIEAQGRQQAFQQAQQAQQFGANLGLQGLQAGLGGLGQAIQGAGQLGQLGTAQLGAQQNIIAAQAAAGREQQALEQSKINQAIQDYATMQQYPLMQLGFMSNMLRGLPMQATTTQTYQATPSALTQGLGVLAGAAGARQAGLFAEGGTIKGLATGGVAGYANRGMVEANPSSGVVRGIREKLMMMTDDQLAQVAQSSASQEVRAMALQILRENKIREQAEDQAKQSIVQDQRGLPTPVTERAGLPAAPAGSMDMLSAASGGIVAFADEGQVKDPFEGYDLDQVQKNINSLRNQGGPKERLDEAQAMLDKAKALRKSPTTSYSPGVGFDATPNMFSLDPEREMEMRQKYIDMFRQQREAAGIGAPKAGLADVLAQEKADVAEARKQARGYDLMRFGTRLATQTGPLLYAAAKAGEATLPGMIQSEQEIKGREREINKGLAEIKEGERLMKIGDIEGGNKLFNQAADRLSKEKIAGTKTPGNMVAYANNYLAEKVAEGDKRDPAIIKREGMQEYMYLYGQAGPRAQTAATTATTNLYDKARDNVDNSLAKNYNSPDNKELRKRQRDDKKNGTNTANEYLQELYRKEEQRLKGGQQAPAAPAPSGDKGNKPKEVIKLD